MDDLQVTGGRGDEVVLLRADAHLCGPPGILQGGLASAALARAAATSLGGTPSRLRARLHRPTATDVDLAATVSTRASDGGDFDAGMSRPDLQVPGASAVVEVALAEVPTSDAGSEYDGPTVSGHVAVGGRPDDAEAHDDLVALAQREPLPRPTAAPAAPHCVVCGARNPRGQHVFPGWFDDGAVGEAWEGDEEVAGAGGMFVRPEVIAALLDCPTVWAGRDACRAAGFGGALLAGFDVTWYSRLPVGEAVRIAAVLDRADGRKLHARSAVVGRDGMVYAVARALQIGVDAMPGADRDLDPFGADLDD